MATKDLTKINEEIANLQKQKKSLEKTNQLKKMEEFIQEMQDLLKLWDSEVPKFIANRKVVYEHCKKSFAHILNNCVRIESTKGIIAKRIREVKNSIEKEEKGGMVTFSRNEANDFIKKVKGNKNIFNPLSHLPRHDARCSCWKITRCDSSNILHCYQCHSNRQKEPCAGSDYGDCFGCEKVNFLLIKDRFYCYDCLSDPKVAKLILAKMNQTNPRTK